MSTTLPTTPTAPQQSSTRDSGEITGTTSRGPARGTRSARPGSIDVEEYAALLEPLLPRAYQAALHLTGNPGEAEDVVQDAALMALKGLDGFQRGTNFRAWFLRIVTNAFLMRCRKVSKSRHDISLDEPNGLFLYERTKHAGMHEGDPDPGRTFLSRMTEEQIHEAIHDLPEQFRVVAALYFVDDLSYQDIADIVGTPVGTVRSRLHRARALLQKCLWDIAVDHGIVASAAVNTLPA